jgi:hypothetical protein
VKLRARHLWRAIEVGDADPDDDIEALDALCKDTAKRRRRHGTPSRRCASATIV